MSIYKSILVVFLDLKKFGDLVTIVSVVQYCIFIIAALTSELQHVRMESNSKCTKGPK
jgi:hypothetical protein